MMYALSLLSLSAHGRAANIVVDTTLGPVQGDAGHEGRSCAAFYGIPYAAPPVDKLRFSPPQSAQPWEKPRRAHHVGKSCLQGFGDSIAPLPAPVERFLETFHIGMEAMSEDCLYLNVFSPSVKPQVEMKAVMVWFHGGSYLGGSGDKQSGIPFFDGHKLCHEGSVVYVGVNYRLGIFGFYASEELLQEAGTAGNMGIQDQRFALQWTTNNAAAFGGDRSRVTIFGESAGAGSVLAHVVSPLSGPYFSAAVMQSGGEWEGTLDDAIARSAGVATVAGCSDLACLRSLHARELLHDQLKSKFSGGPIPDGYEQPLGVDVRALLRSGNFSAKPMLVGTNRNESALFECAGGSKMENMTDFRAHLDAKVNGLATPEQLDRLVELYNVSLYDGLYKRAFIDFSTDIEFFCDSRFILDAVGKQGQPTYAYRLERTVWFFEPVSCFGTPHMTDLFYLFGNFDAILTKGERALGARMRKHWSDFAKQHAIAASWPVYASDRNYLRLQVPTDVPDAQLKEEQCDIIDKIWARKDALSTLVV